MEKYGKIATMTTLASENRTKKEKTWNQGYFFWKEKIQAQLKGCLQICEVSCYSEDSDVFLCTLWIKSGKIHLIWTDLD